eukprot:745742_1
MISNFLNRKKHKKKDKKHKNDKHTSHSNDSSSSYNKMNGSHPTPSIDRTQSDKFSNGHHNKNHLPPNNPSAQSSHSHDDMTADDIKKKQRKFQKKASKKRHSHIGAMRAHQSFKNGIGKSLHVPGDIKEEDETQNNNNNNHKQNGKTSSNNNTSYGMGNTMGHMMSSQQTNKRLEQLMAMRAGKDTKGKSRSVNVAKGKEQKNEYPKKRRSEVHKEPRRHSMFPDKKKNEETHDKHLKDRRKTIEQRNIGIYKKVQYRVKNELFVLYDYYQPVRIIGSGAYAVVCEAIHTVSGKKCAVKKNKGVFDHITDARRILREIKLLLHFNKYHHPDLIEIYDSLPPLVSEIQTFEDVYIVMPLLESNLCKIITSKQKLSNLHYQYLTYQILRGLSFIHESGVIHRDIKPENILLNGSDCDVKIIDFGLARGVLGTNNIDNPENNKATEYVCTRWYRSPEVMCSGGRYDEKMDIWGVGCILAEMILRRPLFPGANYLDQLQQIFDIMGTPKHNNTKWILNDQARNWVTKLPKHNGKNIKKMIKHKFDENNCTQQDLNNCTDLLYKLLELNPNDRISAKQSLSHPYFKDMHDQDE